MVWISGLVGTGSNGNIQFNSIPQTFTHLQLRCFIRGDDAGAITSAAFDFINGTQTYSQHELQGTGSGVSSFGSANISIMNFVTMPGAASTANVFGSIIVDILDYSSTVKNKTVRQIGGYDANGSGYVGLKSAAQYDAATPITQIRLRPYSAANFVSGTRFDLYGITSSQVTGA
jgi:hypothetical protein